MLIPTHDEEAALIARHHVRAERALPADHAAVGDPARGLRQARHAQPRRPAGTRPAVDGLSRAARPTWREAERRFPVVVKPAYKATANRLTVDKAWRADDPATLRRRYREACELVDPDILMLQELIPGDGAAQLSFAALCRDGEVLASLTARRMRQFPMDFGALLDATWRRSTTRPSSATRGAPAARRCGSPGWSRSSSSATGPAQPAARRQPAAVGLAVARRARGRGLPVPAVADGERSRACRRRAPCRACAGSAWGRTCWRSAGELRSRRLSRAVIPALAARPARVRRLRARRSLCRRWSARW